jgi:hypothetical protein
MIRCRVAAVWLLYLALGGGDSVRCLADQSAATPEEIAAWIRDLNHERFSLREAASRRLLRAGAPAIGPLAEAAAAGPLETTVRAVQILCELGQSPDLEIATAAEQALRMLATPRITSASEQAAAALATLDAQAEHRAREALLKLGAAYGSGVARVSGPPDPSHLLLNTRWKGTDDDLRLIERVTQLDFLSLHGTPLSDKGAAILGHFKHLKRVELYGTKVSPRALAALRDALPTTEIDVRGGGLLGVSGSVAAAVCQFNEVRPNSAAEKAGLRTGDIVIRADGQAVDDFRSLTDIIAVKEPGDKMVLDILRDQVRLTVTVTLGRWGE